MTWTYNLQVTCTIIYEDPSKSSLNFLRGPNLFVQEYVPKHDGVASKLSWEMEHLEFESENACWLYTHTHCTFAHTYKRHRP